MLTLSSSGQITANQIGSRISLLKFNLNDRCWPKADAWLIEYFETLLGKSGKEDLRAQRDA